MSVELKLHSFKEVMDEALSRIESGMSIDQAWNHIPEDLQWDMVDAGLGCPHPLTLDRMMEWGSWLYDRRYGLFPVTPCAHTSAAAFLHSMSTGCGFDLTQEKRSEMWIMDTPGTFYKSSVSHKVIVGRLSHLSFNEKTLLNKTGRLLMHLE